MSIPKVNEIGRVPGSASGRVTGATPPVPVRKSAADGAAPEDGKAAQPTPPRFPWLSRLSLQLETAAKQKPAFPAAPVLGDNVDKSA